MNNIYLCWKYLGNMLKYILFACLVACSFVGTPVYGMPEAEENAEMASATMSNTPKIKLTIRNKTVRVQNAEGLTMDIYSLTGAKVTSLRIDSSDKSLTLNVPQGIYIIKVGNVVRKASIA